METSGYLQVVPMSDEEKFKMYMEIPHDELVKMKIESERIMDIQDARIQELEDKLRRLE